MAPDRQEDVQPLENKAWISMGSRKAKVMHFQGFAV